MSAPKAVERWRELVSDVLEEEWRALVPVHGVRWILAQLWQESAGNPRAQSNAGAAGLMQLMPATAREVDVTDRYDPEQSVRGGVRYLKRQYDLLPDRNFGSSYPHISRLLLALASYNCGRGYIEKALKLAIKDREPEWYTWLAVSDLLADARCVVRGRRPDHRQVTDYVERIVRKQLEVPAWPAPGSA